MAQNTNTTVDSSEGSGGKTWPWCVSPWPVVCDACDAGLPDMLEMRGKS